MNQSVPGTLPIGVRLCKNKTLSSANALLSGVPLTTTTCPTTELTRPTSTSSSSGSSVMFLISSSASSESSSSSYAATNGVSGQWLAVRTAPGLRAWCVGSRRVKPWSPPPPHRPSLGRGSQRAFPCVPRSVLTRHRWTNPHRWTTPLRLKKTPH